MLNKKNNNSNKTEEVILPGSSSGISSYTPGEYTPHQTKSSTDENDIEYIVNTIHTNAKELMR